MVAICSLGEIWIKNVYYQINRGKEMTYHINKLSLFFVEAGVLRNSRDKVGSIVIDWECYQQYLMVDGSSRFSKQKNESTSYGKQVLVANCACNIV